MNVPTVLPFVSKVASSVVKQYQGATKGLQNFGRGLAANTASKQKMIDSGKMDVTRY